MAVRQLPDGRWICYFRVSADHETKPAWKRKYFGRGTDAEHAARKYNENLNLAKRRPARKQIGPLFSDLASNYMINKGLPESTRDVLSYQLDATILPALGHKSALSITHQDMNKYVMKRRRDGVKDATIAREITAIKAILTWSVKRQPPLIPSNPIRDFEKPKEDNVVIRPPTAAELRRILKHASPHLARAIMMSYYLGLRPGAVELLSLTWQSVDWERMTILVMSAHKGGPEKRSVPIHEGFKDMLAAWHKQDDHSEAGPIVHYRNRPVQSIRNAWKGALKKAKITRRIRPYDIRHYFVTAAMEDGADIKALSEIVGSSPKTLMRYYQHVSTKLHRDTVAKIPTMQMPSPDPTN